MANLGKVYTAYFSIDRSEYNSTNDGDRLFGAENSLVTDYPLGDLDFQVYQSRTRNIGNKSVQVLIDGAIFEIVSCSGMLNDNNERYHVESYLEAVNVAQYCMVFKDDGSSYLANWSDPNVEIRLVLKFKKI